MAIDAALFFARVNREGVVPGERLSIPQWRERRDQHDATADEMHRLTRQVSDVVRELYVHRDLKRSRHGADAAWAVDALGDPPPPQLPVLHEGMLQAMKTLNDVHTAYRLPKPARNAIAFLPFLIKAYHAPDGTRSYVVTRTVDGDIPLPEFQPGVDIETWNGMPMVDAVRRSAQFEEGATEANDFSLGLQFMTVRWLAASFEPSVDPVRVGFKVPGETRSRDVEFQWTVFVANNDLQLAVVDQAATAISQPVSHRVTSERAINVSSQIVHSWRRRLFRDDEELVSPDKAAVLARTGEELVERFNRGYMGRAALNAFSREFKLLPLAPPAGMPEFSEVPSLLPKFLEASQHTEAGPAYGYIRIRAFPLDPVEGPLFKYELRRLLAMMRGHGLAGDDGLHRCHALLLDVRDNPGGSARNAEGSLQFLTPRTIEPLPFRFRASHWTRRLAGLYNYADYRPSIDAALATGEPFSEAFPITDPIDANILGQQFFGPVLLITSGATYSAGEIFAAGFEDNRVGAVIGVDETTGGGGSNCWFYRNEVALLLDLPQLALDADLQVAVREGLRPPSAGDRAIEEVGVRTKPEARYRLTKRDVMEKRPWGLLYHGMRTITASRTPSVDLDVDVTKKGSRFDIEVTTEGIERLEYALDRDPARGLGLDHGRASTSFNVGANGARLEINGFARRDGSETRVARFSHTFWR